MNTVVIYAAGDEKKSVVAMLLGQERLALFSFPAAIFKTHPDAHIFISRHSIRIQQHLKI